MQELVPDLAALSRRIDEAAVLAPIAEAEQGSVEVEDVPSACFTNLEETKRKTLGKDKDPGQRSLGCVVLMHSPPRTRTLENLHRPACLLAEPLHGREEGVPPNHPRESLQKQKLPLKL